MHLRKKPKKAGTRSGWIIFGAVTLILIGLTIGRLIKETEDHSETGAAIPSGTRSFCIDISHHNGEKIIWDSLKVMINRDGRTVRSIDQAIRILPVEAVYMKASEGETMRDRRFRVNWEEAGKREIRRGAYHFFFFGAFSRKPASSATAKTWWPSARRRAGTPPSTA